MRSRGFTILELMVVVFIIGVLVSIAVPAWQNARESSRRQVCLANMKRLYQASGQWLMEQKANSGSQQYNMNAYIKGQVGCPDDGVYTTTIIGNPASSVRIDCSIHGDVEDPE